jgi:hypothetical protein
LFLLDHGCDAASGMSDARITSGVAIP